MIDLGALDHVLAFFAHPDDETLAAGGTIAKLVRHGVRVTVAIPATGIYSRSASMTQVEMDAAFAELRRDCEKAVGVLGVAAEDLVFGDFPDNAMDSRPRLELIQWLEGVIADAKPAAVFTHHRRCTNIDHQYCHEAAAVATRPSVGARIPLVCGEVPSSTGYLRPAEWEPNFYVEISDADLDAKVKAMQAYGGEARPDPHPRSPEVLRSLAKVRGSEAGMMFAEAFMIHRTFA